MVLRNLGVLGAIWPGDRPLGRVDCWQGDRRSGENDAKLAKEALEKDLPIRDLAQQKNLLDKNELNRLLDLRRMTEDPGATEHGKE